MRPSHLPWLLLLLCTCILSASCSLVSSSTNHTIDDSLGDSVTGAKVQYLPTVPPSDGKLWFDQTACAAGSCADALPNAALALDNTWTAALYLADIRSMSINFQFSGTAIYVFFIIPNIAPASNPSSSVRCVFFIDGSQVGSFTHESDGSGQFTYNELVYSNSSIPNGQHTVIIQTTGSQSAMIIFDYALYTPGIVGDGNGNIKMVTSAGVPSTTMPLSQVAPTDPSTTADTQPSSSSETAGAAPSDSDSIPPFPSAPLSPLASSPSESSTANPIPPLPLSSTPLVPAAATTPEIASEQPTNSKPTGAIIAGSIVGAFILFGFIIVLFAVCRRRRQRLRDSEGPETTSPFDLLPERPDPPPAKPSEVLRRPLPYSNSYTQARPSMPEVASGRSTPNKMQMQMQMSAPAQHGTGVGMYEPPFARHPEPGFLGHSVQSSVSSSSYPSSDDARSDRLHIHIPAVLRPEDPAPAPSPGGLSLLTPLHSAAPSQLTHPGAPVHSPITRNGVPIPPAQAEIVRELLLNALSGSRNGSFDLGSGFSAAPSVLSPKSKHGEEGQQQQSEVLVEGEPMVHTDSGMRFSRAMMDVPPAYAAR